MLMCCDNELTPTARIVGVRLASHAGYDTFAFPSAKTLAMDLGIGERTVKTALRQLRERGWVKRLRRLGFSGPMAYALSTDAEIEHAIKIRLEGNKVIRDCRRLIRQPDPP
jgi:DNA-binding transcriptional regulator YhcF (GntR family)